MTKQNNKAAFNGGRSLVGNSHRLLAVPDTGGWGQGCDTRTTVPCLNLVLGPRRSGNAYSLPKPTPYPTLPTLFIQASETFNDSLAAVPIAVPG